MRRTVGVEEEFLLVRADCTGLAHRGEDVVEAAQERSPDGELVDHELKRAQIESGTAPVETLTELGAELHRLRTELAAAAEAESARLVALGTSPFIGGSGTVDEPRYRRMRAEFGAVAADQLTCGQHVHLSVESRAEGVAVVDRLRPWLALVRAVSSNSPMWQAADTGYASYRSIRWSMWPTAGATEPFGDEAGYDRVVAELIETGAALDDGMIYFDARLSARYPTVEIRVADVCTDAGDALLVAALCRALVEQTARDWRAGVPAPAGRVAMTRAAHWRAARYGLDGSLVGLGGLLPAEDAVAELVGYAGEALTETGDDTLVGERLAALWSGGTGAARQRAILAGDGSLADLVADAGRRTTSSAQVYAAAAGG